MDTWGWDVIDDFQKDVIYYNTKKQQAKEIVNIYPNKCIQYNDKTYTFFSLYEYGKQHKLSDCFEMIVNNK